jgi:aspartate kinase
LGREGSDYSAAIFAYCLNAANLTIWKDVAGMYNADPRMFENVVKLNEVSYRDAIELSYYGASVIHPKTIQPLQNKSIPLYVKSFLNPREKGTIIHSDAKEKTPCYIVKEGQILISIATRDFSFIAESHLSEIFTIFDKIDLKINIMQNSALNFSVLVDERRIEIEKVLKSFPSKFSVRYNMNLRLITIRHFNQDVIDQLIKGKEVLLEQQTRETVRFVVR